MTLVGRQFGGFLRAELSSNGSIRSRGETVSADLFVRRSTRSGKDKPFGTTTAFGPYENFMFEFDHYAFGGVRATSTFVLVSSTSTSGSNRRVPPPRGSPRRSPLLDISFVRLYPFGFIPPTRRFFMPRGAACGSTLSVGPLSLLRIPRFLSCVRLCACSTSSARSDVFSRPRSRASSRIASDISSLLHHDDAHVAVQQDLRRRSSVHGICCSTHMQTQRY